MSREARPRLSGAEGETAAAELLQSLGHRILERNFRCQVGEIDLITVDGETLVFVEVKTRVDLRFGGAAAAVDRRKRRRVVRASEVYLCQPEKEGLQNGPCRFDVVAAAWLPETGRWRFTHYPDAFTVDDSGGRSWLW